MPPSPSPSPNDSVMYDEKIDYIKVHKCKKGCRPAQLTLCMKYLSIMIY